MLIMPDTTPADAGEQDIMPLEEAARAVNTPPTTVRGWVNRGLIQGYYPQLGRHRVFVSLKEIREKLTPRPGKAPGKLDGED